MRYTLLQLKRVLLGKKKAEAISNSCFYDDTKKYNRLNAQYDKFADDKRMKKESSSKNPIRTYEKNNRRNKGGK